MKLSTESLERAKSRPHPSMTEHLRHDIEEQLELDGFPPMTANRAKDFARDCKRCQVACDYCIPATGVNLDFDPLGR